ncbi:SprT-like domain-containing protein [Pseudomonas psychrophila]|uniref:SprT-like domain-containing protein n=1 Tax=Pseudomonas psychrophila TaxID=122355 RepID=A0A8I1FW65_9PSED|nr:SprT-like domain-containing protein [Pseudomonas psychrophila]AVX93361.1 hypothetical protein PkP19E3_35310 [Pseudomonas koreensis]MBJ2258835.1 SprT-like domain-containing protein [Pseudomonas psychrophila]
MLPVDEIKAIKERVTECLHLASAHFGKIFPEIPVRFDLTGTRGGYYCFDECPKTGRHTGYFQFNRALVRENLTEYLVQICPHEVAHYVSMNMWGKRIKPHGPEWKSVMIEAYNLEPARCHQMDTSKAAKRSFIYTCGCRDHAFTKTKHNKVLRGYGYKCRACSNPLVFKREEKPTEPNLSVIPKLFVSTADAPLSEAHIHQIATMIIDHQVLALVADPLMTSDAKLQKLGLTLKVSAAAVARHPNPSTLPGGVTHAIIFGDSQLERQQRVAKAFEQRGVIVRKVRAAKG